MSLPTESSARTRTRVRVDVWTDLVCPWCYLGEHRLKQAIAGSGIDAEIVLHSFELHPEWRVDVIETVPAIATRVHGIAEEEARRLEDGMTQKAHREGLPFTVDRPVSNTFTVHRLLHLATDLGVGNEYFEDIQQEYFAGRLDPFDPDAMVEAGVRHGIPEAATRRVMASEEYSEAVQADQAQARDLGVTGVPFMVFAGRFAVSGAQSVAGYENALTRASEVVQA